MRRLVAAGIGVVATLGTIGIAAPAQAATTAAKPFELIYGNSFYTGTVNFSNRSVTATGEVKSTVGGGCRFGEVTAFVGDKGYPVGRTRSVCDGDAVVMPITSTADVPGGPTSVVLTLCAVDSHGSVTPLRSTSRIAR
ncbi:hypothetical protein [Kribbella sp. NPDC006257]|uniref:hypothetical protein n=1 Tax=Kribbella sp. NPDC006257 TaxID=3156738 RepID=UPI0033B56887